MHTKIWWSYVHIRYLIHVQKWTYLALGWPYGWALNFNQHNIILCMLYSTIVSCLYCCWILITGILIDRYVFTIVSYLIGVFVFAAIVGKWSSIKHLKDGISCTQYFLQDCTSVRQYFLQFLADGTPCRWHVWQTILLSESDSFFQMVLHADMVHISHYISMVHIISDMVHIISHYISICAVYCLQTTPSVFMILLKMNILITKVWYELIVTVCQCRNIIVLFLLLWTCMW